MKPWPGPNGPAAALRMTLCKCLVRVVPTVVARLRKSSKTGEVNGIWLGTLKSIMNFGPVTSRHSWPISSTGLWM